MTNPVAMITVNPNFPADLLRRATRIKFCMINQATKQRMCIQVPFLDNNYPASNPNYLPGSPIIMLPSSQSDDIQAIGVYTGFDSITNSTISKDVLSFHPDLKDYEDDVINITSQVSSSVRLNKQINKMVSDFAERNKTALMTALRSARHDCFPSISSKSDELCLCSLGWKNEMDDCLDGDVPTLPNGCKLDASSLRFSCRRGTLEADPQFKNIVLPGCNYIDFLRGL